MKYVSGGLVSDPRSSAGLLLPVPVPEGMRHASSMMPSEPRYQYQSLQVPRQEAPVPSGQPFRIRDTFPTVLRMLYTSVPIFRVAALTTSHYQSPSHTSSADFPNLRLFPIFPD